MFYVESGGFKMVDYVYFVWKKCLDFKGLLNSGKFCVWDLVKDLFFEDIEVKVIE